MLLSLICTILSLVSSWIIFKKMGREGWEGIIPIYSFYVLCAELYGNGWKFLCTLIPIYNIYFLIKLYIDWAKAFNKGTGFGIGMIFLPFIFQLILAFSDSQYGDGSMANSNTDFVSQVVDKTKTMATNAVAPKDPTEELKKYKELLDLGIITEDEFNEKKRQLMGM